MKKDFKAMRVEMPSELYDRFKEQSKKDYKKMSAIVRDYIVQYVRERENESKA